MYAVPLVSQEGWHGSTGELQVKAGALIRRKRIKEKYKYFSGIIMFRHFTEKKKSKQQQKIINANHGKE